MKYKIIDAQTGKELCACCWVVTQDGEVAYRHEELGFKVEQYQSLYQVVISEEEKS